MRLDEASRVTTPQRAEFPLCDMVTRSHVRQ